MVRTGGPSRPRSRTLPHWAIDTTSSFSREPRLGMGRLPAASSLGTGAGRSSRAERRRTRHASSWSGPRTRRGSTARWWCCGTTSPPGTRTSGVGTAPSSTKVATPALRSRRSAWACTVLPSTRRACSPGTPNATGRSRSRATTTPSTSSPRPRAWSDPTVRTTASTRWAGSMCAGSSPRERHSPQPASRRISMPSSRRRVDSTPSCSPCTSVAERRSRSATPS